MAWLQQAEAAQRKIKGLLPTVWAAQLEPTKAKSQSAKPWLVQLQQQGDRWRRMPFPALAQCAQGLANARDQPHECARCGKEATQLRTCSACKEAKYCR